MTEPTSSATLPRSTCRRWSTALLAALASVAISACGGTTAHRPAATPAAPTQALGGSGNGQSQWFHLDAGTYRITLKADNGGVLDETVLMRHQVAGPNPDGTFTDAQAPVVAFQGGVGGDVQVLPAGDYVLVVAALDSRPWTVTVVKVS